MVPPSSARSLAPGSSRRVLPGLPCVQPTSGMSDAPTVAVHATGQEARITPHSARHRWSWARYITTYRTAGVCAFSLIARITQRDTRAGCGRSGQPRPPASWRAEPQPVGFCGDHSQGSCPDPGPGTDAGRGDRRHRSIPAGSLPLVSCAVTRGQPHRKGPWARAACSTGGGPASPRSRKTLSAADARILSARLRCMNMQVGLMQVELIGARPATDRQASG
jgi:hypothetical protein